MDKYEILKQIGDGTYGTVAKAIHKKTGQLVAIKRMKQKYYSWDECIKLAEVQALRKLHAHPNVIKLKEVLRERNELFFVFEFMDGDLLGVIRAAKANPPLNPQAPMIPHTKVRAIMYQMFQSLAHLHKCGYFHRDLKPENLLIKYASPNGNNNNNNISSATSSPFDIVKLADFGLVKEIRAKPPFTDYVSTRWYRGPELLLQDRTYSSPVDMWAAGCIMVELMSTRPLFPGSNELDQLFRIISVFGPPTEKTWPEGCAMARKLRYTFPNPAVTPLRKMVPSHTPPNAYDLIEKLLVYDPRKRLSAAQALQHPYFTVGGIGLDGPLAFQQPLETAGVMRPQNTSSAPPSQLVGGGGNGNGGGATSSNNNTISGGGLPPVHGGGPMKPGSADRPLMPPVQISRPSNNVNNGGGGGGFGSNATPRQSIASMSNNISNNNNTMGGGLPASFNHNKSPSPISMGASTTANGFGKQYHITSPRQTQMGGANNNNKAGLGGGGGGGGGMNSNNNTLTRNPTYASPSPLPPPSSGAGTTQQQQQQHNQPLFTNTFARPPTKIESPLPIGAVGGNNNAIFPSPHAATNAMASPLPALASSSSSSNNNTLTAKPRASIAVGNDDLDDLLEEFSKNVERDAKRGSMGNSGSTSMNPYKPSPSVSALAPITAQQRNNSIASVGGNGNNGPRPSLPSLNTNATQSQIDESPLQKLLNGARYRNGSSGDVSNNNNGNNGNDTVLQPTSIYANGGGGLQQRQPSATDSNNGGGVGRRKVVPATTQLTSNTKPLLDKLSQFNNNSGNSPVSDPAWLQ